ncbi:MAG: 2-C-methyl-D-erythritol 2,4-cyclodiphosphate synthase [Candidatus Dormibacteria bacterium]|jgi:2-C-methyl-D-erythritol 2,4-cyclodiphosphate synthase
MTLRIGHGLDAHRLAPGRPLLLGCVAVPSDQGLVGHSDGDVVAHALADACLGAAGLGTMGEHFPSGDERWRGVGGREFLELVAAKLAEAGARVVSAQVAVVCARPRLAPFFAAMGEAMSEALATPRGTVVVSATSGDGLGDTGRGEGILASAVALLEVG